jgi:hypothetical protein
MEMVKVNRTSSETRFAKSTQFSFDDMPHFLG